MKVDNVIGNKDKKYFHQYHHTLQLIICIGTCSNMFSLDDSPLLGQHYTSHMCFVQRCNFVMYFTQPLHWPHSPLSKNIAPNTLGQQGEWGQ